MHATNSPGDGHHHSVAPPRVVVVGAGDVVAGMDVLGIALQETVSHRNRHGCYVFRLQQYGRIANNSSSVDCLARLLLPLPPSVLKRECTICTSRSYSSLAIPTNS